MLLFLNVIYVLIAISMIALILMQRGAGAQAGSGFGGGASATVFGARGSSNFLSKATKWLAVAFFVISLFMAWNAARTANSDQPQQDQGLMSRLVAPAAQPSAPAAGGNSAVPTAPAAQPAPSAPASAVPQAPAGTAPASQAPAPASSVPAAPVQDGKAPAKQPATGG